MAAGAVWLAYLGALPGSAFDRSAYSATGDGAFNLFAWQAIWILALWLGAKSAQGENPLSRLPGFVFPLSGAICLFFLGVRHDWLGAHLTQESLGLSLDKWQIGPLRMLNLFAFSCLIYGSRKYLTRVVLVEPFLTLGKASLEVFCAHLFFVFVGLAPAIRRSDAIAWRVRLYPAGDYLLGTDPGCPA